MRPAAPLDPRAVTERLERASELSTLDPARRLDAKIGMGAHAVTRRLRVASELAELNALLARAGRAHDGR